MALRILPAVSDADLRAFVDLPWAVYRDCPLWVPPIRKDDLRLLTPGRHPFWDTARRELFIAWRDGRPVGRIAAIVDARYNDFAKVRCGAFGFFECLPGEDAAAHGLLSAAAGWLRDQGMDFMRGPLNPSTNYTCGLLVGGYDEEPGLMMPWNPPAYAAWFEQFHLRKEQDLFAYLIEKDRIHVEPWLEEELARLKGRGDFTRRTSSKKTLKEDVSTMIGIYREAWANNFAFSPLSEAEAAELVKELCAYLDPNFFVLFFHEGRAAGGMVALPNFNPLLRRLNGRIGLSAPWHFLRTRRLLKEGYRIILFGIREEYRLLGLPLLVFDYMLEQARQSPDFRWVEGSWVLEDNTAVDDLIEDFSGRLTKRYRLYRKELL